MNEDSFLEQCAENGYDEKARAQFEEALLLTQNLKTKKRLSGDSYFDHNVRVATILLENHATPEVVTAALVHHVLPTIPEARIRELFGADILTIIKGEEEIKTLKERNEMAEAETLRKIFLTTFKDVRIIVLKLANKLDNLRTMQQFNAAEQERIALEALEVYAPLAYRLGMERLKNQLEDQALQILDPDGYQKIVTFLEHMGAQREREVEQVIAAVQTLCAGKVEVSSIKGRLKHVYSIYKKVKLKKLSLEELYDLLGIRIIVPEVKDCYVVLGILHENFEPVDGRLKDYIATPKPNFYRSIHTAVVLPNRKKVEVQIRTAEMDEFAEEGIAAHWRYKGIKSDEYFEKKIGWLRGLLELQKNEDTQELLESAKVDIFGDEIYCYTPKGDMKELPRGATVLDFAYSVHEHIGNHAVGGKVNGKFVPLKEELAQGDVVEIVTNKKQRPRRSWIKFVKSTRAKQKIRKSLREYETVAPLLYRAPKPLLQDNVAILVESQEFPKAACVLAKCCHALPGEEIVGIVTKRRIISVHKRGCRAAEKEEERWVDVTWKDSFAQKITFFVDAEERSGVLADVLHTIASAGFEVKEAKAKLIDRGHVQCSFTVIPRGLEQLQEMVTRVKKVKSVTKIYFE